MFVVLLIALGALVRASPDAPPLGRLSVSLDFPGVLGPATPGRYSSPAGEGPGFAPLAVGRRAAAVVQAPAAPLFIPPPAVVAPDPARVGDFFVPRGLFGEHRVRVVDALGAPKAHAFVLVELGDGGELSFSPQPGALVMGTDTDANGQANFRIYFVRPSPQAKSASITTTVLPPDVRVEPAQAIYKGTVLGAAPLPLRIDVRPDLPGPVIEKPVTVEGYRQDLEGASSSTPPGFEEYLGLLVSRRRVNVPMGGFTAFDVDLLAVNRVTYVLVFGKPSSWTARYFVAFAACEADAGAPVLPIDVRISCQIVDREGRGFDGDPDNRDASGIDGDSIELSWNELPVLPDSWVTRVAVGEPGTREMGFPIGLRIGFLTFEELLFPGTNTLRAVAKDRAGNPLREDAASLEYRFR